MLLNKKQIRLEILKLRNDFVKHKQASLEVAKNFYEYIDHVIAPGSTIAGYYPANSELNILPILENLHKRKFNIVLPVIADEYIEFHQWNPSIEMLPSKYIPNILEPQKGEEYLIPDLVIAPLVACDYLGNRLGGGKGMYDKKITQLRMINPNLLYVGLCYDFQLLDNIPSENHDQKLNIIITESKKIELF